MMVEDSVGVRNGRLRDAPPLALVHGGAEPFEVFYRREFRGIVALSFALSGSGHAAEDVAQEAFLAAHARWGEIGCYDNPVSWVRRVAINKAASASRRRFAESRALIRLSGRRDSGVASLEAPDEEFWREVRRLPQRQTQVVTLHYLFDLSVADVAATLQISEGAVKAHLHRARAALAQSLALWKDVVR